MPDDPHDRPTQRPPRPSTRRLFASPADSRRLQEAQERILEALRSGVINMVNRFFGDAKEVVHTALLHASHDVYTEGLARGKAQATLVFEAYIEAVHEAYATQQRDPRVEIERPLITLATLHGVVAMRGIDLTAPELAVLCGELRLALAPGDAQE